MTREMRSEHAGKRFWDGIVSNYSWETKMTRTKSSSVANSARAWRGSLFATAAIIAGGLATLFATAAEAQEIKRGGTLIMARPDEPLTFDPFIPGDNGSIYA